MTETGEMLTLPGGTTARLVERAEATQGERVEFEFTVPPGAPSPPLHFHPSQEERQEVVAGMLSVRLDGSWRSLREGESVSIAPGQAHTVVNRSSETARFRDVHVPALDFQHYIEALHRLTQEGKITSMRSPSTLIYLSLVLCEHRETQLTANAAQRAAESFLASIGRLLGYRTA
jgi:quercetin dioxygenase-like cupin family protein